MVIWWLFDGYLVVIWWLFGGYLVVIWWLFCGYLVVIWWFEGGSASLSIDFCFKGVVRWEGS